MSLQVEKMEKNMAKLTIEVAAEDLEKAMQNAGFPRTSPPAGRWRRYPPC